MKTMQALQWDGKLLTVNTVPVPEPAQDEVLVRLSHAGICNTDLEIIRGYYPFNGTLGHEFVGIIEKAADNNLTGQRVVADINHSCGTCSMCDAGQPHHCLHRSALGIKDKDGAFAEFLTIPAINLVHVPDNVPDEAAVFAEPLAAALEIQEQLDFSKAKKVAVIGDGKLGLLIAMSLLQTGLEVTLIGHHPDRKKQLGLDDINYLSELPSEKYPVVIEATGSPAGFDDALNLTAARGTLVLKSTYGEPLKFNPAPIVVNEITVLGSRCGPMEKAIACMAKGSINPALLIEDTFHLEDGVDAIARANSKGTLKVLLTMSD